MRYHKKSTIITTNLDYPQWYEVFKSKDLVDAMLDRFKHYCTTIYIKGDSLRTTGQTKKDKSVVASDQLDEPAQPSQETTSKTA